MTEFWAQGIWLMASAVAGGSAVGLWLRFPGAPETQSAQQLNSKRGLPQHLAPITVDDQALVLALKQAQQASTAMQRRPIPVLPGFEPAALDGPTSEDTESRASLLLLAQQTQRLLESLQAQEGFLSHSLSSNEVLRDTLGKVSAGANLVDARLGQVSPMFNEAALLCTAVADHLQALQDGSRLALSRAIAVQSEWQGAFGLLGDFGHTLAALQEGVSSVQDLANKAKLLSLNAAIVASQSQEHGQGFGVVAEQIKVMAQKTLETAQAMQEEVQGVASFRDRFEALTSQQQQTLSTGRSDHQAVQQRALVAISTHASLGQMLGQRAQAAAHEDTAVTDLKEATGALISGLIDLNANLRLQDKDHRRALALAAEVARKATTIVNEPLGQLAPSQAVAREPALLACLAWQQRHAQEQVLLRTLDGALAEAQHCLTERDHGPEAAGQAGAAQEDTISLRS